MTLKKELNYLSLPDYFNKFLLKNFHQKIEAGDFIVLKFELYNNNSVIKAISLLEYIFPRKTKAIKIIIKKKKTFNTKNSYIFMFSFNLNISTIEFIEFLRFFEQKPFNKSMDFFPLVTNKLKTFQFNSKIKTIKFNLTNSFFFVKNFHLN